MSDPRPIPDNDITNLIPMESLEGLRDEALDVVPELGEMPGYEDALQFVADIGMAYYEETPDE